MNEIDAINTNGLKRINARVRSLVFLFGSYNSRIFSTPNKKTIVTSIVKNLREVKLNPKTRLQMAPTKPCRIKDESISEFFTKSNCLKFLTCVKKSQSSLMANSPNGLIMETESK